MRALLFDLDGVIYQEGQAIAGAVEVLAWVRAQRIPHLFLTNTSSRSRRAIVSKLAGMGIEVAEAEIFTPAVAAVDWLRANVSGRTALFIPEETKKEFRGLPLLDADAEQGAAAVVVGDLGQGWNFVTLNRAFRLLMGDSKPQLIALGMSRYWRAPEGLRLDTAPFVVALEHAAGVKPLVLGKPAEPFFQAALDILGSTAADTLMIGDDIRGDIGGAQNAGLSGMLVRTGKYRPDDLKQGVTPDAVIDSIADLPSWWRENGLDKSATHAPNHWVHFSHVADIGVRGYGRSLAESFEQTALAMTAVICDPLLVQPQERVRVSCEAADDELLLVQWLNALIYEMSVRGMLFSRFKVEISGLQLMAVAYGEQVDRQRHMPAVEVKGATYTELRVRQREGGGWLAQCVVDV